MPKPEPLDRIVRNAYRVGLVDGIALAANLTAIAMKRGTPITDQERTQAIDQAARAFLEALHRLESFHA